MDMSLRKLQEIVKNLFDQVFWNLLTFFFQEVFLFVLKYLFIYLSSLSLTCSSQDLWFSLQHTGHLVAMCELLVVACGIQFPDQGSNPGPLHWEHGVLATGPPGNFQTFWYFWQTSQYQILVMFWPLTLGCLTLFLRERNIKLIRLIWYVKLHGKHCQMSSDKQVTFYG